MEYDPSGTRFGFEMGTHYTGEEDIILIMEPVLMAPLRREWSEFQVECGKLREKADGLSGKKRANAIEKIGAKLRVFADKITAIKVLDPACGSGNFQYVTLRLLLDLQNEVINYSDELGAGRFFFSFTPAQLYGIETNEYAYELAQITIQREPSPISTTPVPPGWSWRTRNWIKPSLRPTAGRATYLMRRYWRSCWR
jgi:hypothetical protein